MSWFFASGGQSIEASASTSILPMNIQSRFHLGLTGLIFLQSKGLSRVFSNTTVQKHQFFSRGTRDQIANICWIIEKAREFQKNIYFCFIDYVKAFDCVDHKKLWKILRDGNTRPPDLPLEKPICRSGSNS